MEGRLRFEEVEIDPERGELTRGGAPVPVEPQVLDLIVFLARNPGRVVSREQIIDTVWGGRAVSDSAISSRMNAARIALADDGTAQRVIRTVQRRGYLFVPEVTRAADTRDDAPTLPTRASVAVLPFQNMSGDPEQGYFSDGITDDIITELARYSELFVTARHSSFAYRDPDRPLRDIAEALGVRFIAEGSVRRAGPRVRVTARLIDPWIGNEIWAERFDRELEDIFAVQDEITEVIVNTLAGQIARQHYLGLQSKRPETIDAYDHTLKATEHALRVSPSDNALARAEAERAVALDPGFARAHAILALAHVNEGNNLWTADPATAFRLSSESASRAVAADPRDPWGHAMLGISELWHRRDTDRALAAMRRAVDLNPGNAQVHGLYSYVLTYAGQPEAALAELELAMRQNPHHPAIFLGFRARALLFLNRVDEAMPYAEHMAQIMPGHSNALAFLAIGYAAAGRTKDAQDAAAELAATNPHYTLDAVRRFFPYARQDDMDFTLTMLGRAGLPEIAPVGLPPAGPDR